MSSGVRDPPLVDGVPTGRNSNLDFLVEKVEKEETVFFSKSLFLDDLLRNIVHVFGTVRLTRHWHTLLPGVCGPSCGSGVVDVCTQCGFGLKRFL